MIQATTAIGEFMQILLTTACVAAAQLAGVALLALGSSALGARFLWRSLHH